MEDARTHKRTQATIYTDISIHALKRQQALKSDVFSLGCLLLIYKKLHQTKSEAVSILSIPGRVVCIWLRVASSSRFHQISDRSEREGAEHGGQRGRED